MAVIKRTAVKEPVQRKETVPMASQGGDVVVRGLGLDELLELSNVQSTLREPVGEESQDDAHARAGAKMVAKTLHLGVVLADGKPMWSEEQWNLHGSGHLVECMTLFAAVNRLSGRDLATTTKN
jgi:hypothetical protein